MILPYNVVAGEEGATTRSVRAPPPYASRRRVGGLSVVVAACLRTAMSSKDVEVKDAVPLLSPFTAVNPSPLGEERFTCIS